MSNRSNCLPKIVAALVLAISISSVAFAETSSNALAQAKPTPNAPEAEVNAVTAINGAPDAAAKLTLAEAFVKKYPKSTLRLELAQYLASEVARVSDVNQRLTFAERLNKLFSSDAELNSIRPVLIDSYVRAKRIDDAFSLGATILAKQPDNVGVLATLALVGTEEIKRKNSKYSTQTLQYGLKAIELIEANRKPADLDDAAWAHQTSLLPHLYLGMGALALAGGKPAEARPRLEKAIALNPTEPTAYVFLGGLVDDEYAAVAQSLQAMPEGKQKQEGLKKATELMDKVIDLYARGLGAASDKAEYKPLYDQVLESITPYYKYRHNRSTDGLQQLIDTYKVPAKP